jgi:hypothetical protein
MRQNAKLDDVVILRERELGNCLQERALLVFARSQMHHSDTSRYCSNNRLNNNGTTATTA